MANQAEQIRDLRERAESGSMRCRYALGLRYLLNRTQASDISESLRWLRLSAGQGYCLALELLAFAYANGAYGLPKDSSEAQYWTDKLNRSASKSVSAACPTPESVRLYEYMAEISEEHWCAGWYDTLEFDLWSAMLGGPRSYGLGELSQQDLDVLRSLSEACEGWVAWTESSATPTLVDRSDWDRLYSERKDRMGNL